MDVTSAKKAVLLIIGLTCAYFLATIISVALLSRLQLSAPVGAVCGFLLFAIIFLLIIRGIEKISGRVFFTFNQD